MTKHPGTYHDALCRISKLETALGAAILKTNKAVRTALIIGLVAVVEFVVIAALCVRAAI